MEGEARKPGERRLQILQTLASMLQEPQPEKITTAALAARIGVSEAALYRHFSSKAQMYEGLIEFIEQTLFGLIARITADTPSPVAQAEAIVLMLRREGLAGATVFRGIEGFGASSRIHTAKALRLSEDLPILIECVDRAENVERVLPILDDMVTEGLVTIEKAEIRIYRGRTG